MLEHVLALSSVETMHDPSEFKHVASALAVKEEAGISTHIRCGVCRGSGTMHEVAECARDLSVAITSIHEYLHCFLVDLCWLPDQLTDFFFFKFLDVALCHSIK